MESKDLSKVVDEPKFWASLVHFSFIISAFMPLGSLILPTLMFIKKKDDSYVESHIRGALNFAILLTVLGVILMMGNALFMSQLNQVLSQDLAQPNTIQMPSEILGSVLSLASFGISCLALAEGLYNGLKAIKGESPSYHFVIRVF